MLAAAAVLLLAAPLDVPFVPQRKDTCGAAALAMVFAYWGQDVGHDAIAEELLEPDRVAVPRAARGDLRVEHRARP